MSQVIKDIQNKEILNVKNLCVYFAAREGIIDILFNKSGRIIKAVDDISFKIQEKEVLGLVGETGSGKSTIGKAIVLFYKPTKGEIIFKGDSINNLSGNNKINYLKKVQIILQDPYSSLNPRMKMYEILKRPLVALTNFNKKEIGERILDITNMCGLSRYDFQKFPHEFSGGQRQRICIARSLLTNPLLLIADEPTSALDVSIQAQILNLFKDLKEKLDLTILFISHDISIVLFICNYIAVMYSGKIVEIIPSEKLLLKSLHPYTKKLISAVPKGIDSRNSKNLNIFHKNYSTIINKKTNNCVFLENCPITSKTCNEISPELVKVDNNHFVACHNL